MFSINNADDLLQKCLFTNEQIKLRLKNPYYEYHLMDNILALNMIFEWFLKDKTLEDDVKLQCIQLFNPYESPCDVSNDFKHYYKLLDTFPSKNRLQSSIRLLCNKAKHCTSKIIEIQKNKYTCGAGHYSMFAGSPYAITGYSLMKYFIEIDEEETDLEIIINNCLEQWKNFLDSIK